MYFTAIMGTHTCICTVVNLNSLVISNIILICLVLFLVFKSIQNSLSKHPSFNDKML